jgi:DNA (cytosine-5)-methyltransferase 1
MKVLDLFAGIGGFSYAAHLLGWQTTAFVERDKFCQKVLRKNFGQDIKIYDDITTFDAREYAGTIDVVCGGFPCQPFSQAGKQKGRADERHLFPQMLRVISEVKPTFVVAENVRRILTIEGGEVFKEIIASLESEGYEVATFCIPACAVNAPHKRDRIWIIANADSTQKHAANNGSFGLSEQQGRCVETRRKALRQTNGKADSDESCGCCATSANSDRNGRTQDREKHEAGFNGTAIYSGRNTWSRNWLEAATTLCRVDDGISRQLDRTNRLRALGNAVVPQVVLEIFKAIEQADKQTSIPAF